MGDVVDAAAAAGDVVVVVVVSWGDAVAEEDIADEADDDRDWVSCSLTDVADLLRLLLFLLFGGDSGGVSVTVVTVAATEEAAAAGTAFAALLCGIVFDWLLSGWC